MKPKTLSWNVRGLNDGDKYLRVRNLLREWKVDIVCFQETKLEVVSRSVVRSLWGCHNVDWGPSEKPLFFRNTSLSLSLSA
jgi:exonuclease III